MTAEEEKIAKLTQELKELKKAAGSVLEQNQELKTDIAQMAKHAQALYSEIAPMIPKSGGINPMLVMQMIPKIQDPEFLVKINGQVEPLLELMEKYK